MTTQQAITYFGDHKKLAKALGISPNAIYQWSAYPPRLRQFELERLTFGRLAVDV
jgi:DNA-binding transcriptional regulator YdaS (Cro superfamily)|tara:strand:+ start:763 stop:927 length:165 start_codon:yes stop_codon:yes gene_type:complete